MFITYSVLHLKIFFQPKIRDTCAIIAIKLCFIKITKNLFDFYKTEGIVKMIVHETHLIRFGMVKIIK